MSLESILNRIYSRLVFSLILATVLIHAVLLAFEVRQVGGKFFDVLFRQVNSLTRMNTQLGDLISLQRNLEALSSPLSEALPVQVTVRRDQDQKLLVNSRSENFREDSIFMFKSESNLTAHPFGTLTLAAAFDYRRFVAQMFVRMIISCLLIGSSLFISKIYIYRMNRATVLPIDQLSEWISQLTPENIKEEKAELPEGALAFGQLASGVNMLLSQVRQLSEKIVQSELQQRMADIAAQVSHDIRSPLSSLQILLSKARSLPQEERQLMERSIAKIQIIASDLLGSRRKLQSTSSPSLKTAMEWLIEEKKLEFQSKPGVLFELRATADVRADVDPVELQRVLSNLVNNSFEAMGEPGRITIELATSDAEIVITVSDTGNGIPIEMLTRIRLGQAVTEGKGGSGNALGLRLAREFAERNGGRLEIYSRIGQGTIVTLRLRPDSNLFAISTRS